MAEGEPPFRYVPPIDPNIGRAVDGHVLESLLARGGMGAAYVAAHRALARSKCVVKLVLAEIARHPQGIVRFQLEAEALSIFKHDNIVRLLNFGVLEDGQLYLRFEFIDGKSLERYLIDHGGRLNIREAVYLIFQCCSALQYAHDLGVIHRDLKPDNIMIEFNPAGSTLRMRIKILDFGIARVIASAVDPTGSGVVLGTPRFMAPEQVTNAAHVTGAADVFALGQLLYWMLTGNMPWGIPDSDIAIYHKQRTEAPAWPPEQLVAAELASIIMKCLSMNPANRPTMRELALELAAAIPAENGLESGTQILEKIVPHWVTSSTPDAVTLPRSAVAAPTSGRFSSPSVDKAATADRERLSPGAGTPAPTASPPTPVEAPRRPRSRAEAVTENARPRALAGSLASAGAATFGLSAAAPSMSARAADSLSHTPSGDSSDEHFLASSSAVLAALPTGLNSERHPAQNPTWLESQTTAREPSIIVTAEIQLATGTPGPRPYAHRELPTVLVSNTLSGLTPQDGAQNAPRPHQPEPIPFVVLPGVTQVDPAPARSASSKVVLLLLGAGVLGVAAMLVVAKAGSRSTTSDNLRHADVANAAGPAAGLVAPQSDAAVGESPQEHLALSTDSDAGIASDAVGTIPTSSGSAVSVSQPEPVQSTTTKEALPSRRDIRIGPPAEKQDSSAPSDTVRAAPQRQTASLKTLRTRQLEARSNGAKTGNLHLLVTPWAVCWVDGERIDQTPCMLDELPVGRYRVRLENSAKQQVDTFTAVVKAGETTTIERAW